MSHGRRAIRWKSAVVSKVSEGSEGGTIKILVVGQTPPPLGGQSIMIQSLLEGRYRNVTLFHVRMAFSRGMNEVGKFRGFKLFHLISVIARMIFCRFRHGANVLYYCPAGPDKIPMYRDLILLTSTRHLFRRVIFHFHAAGISTLYDRLTPWTRGLFRLAYFNPDVAIRLSEQNPEDGKKLVSRKEYIIPNGISDQFISLCGDLQKSRESARILFVGVLRRSKGLLVLIEACRILRERGLEFSVDLVGEFESQQFERLVRALVSRSGLESQFQFLGVLSGHEKIRAYSRAGIFCYPSFFESESFGLVVLEAMQCALPVVATRWRGIPSIVRDGVTGFVVPVEDSVAIAEKLSFLLGNPELAKEMGRNGREVYLQNYTLSRFRANMQRVFGEVGDGQAGKLAPGQV